MRALWLGLLLVLWSGCSSDSQDPPFADIDVKGRDTNPDGLAYPTEDLGGTPRTVFAPGNRIPNFSFQGYPHADRSKGLQVISLADYYDPNQQRNKILHLMAIVAWCPHCRGQTALMVQLEPTLRAKGLEIVQTVMQGLDESPPSLAEFDNWVTEHGTNLTCVFDSSGRRLGSIANVSSIPWNALIDTRTMEILQIDPGTIEDYEGYVNQGLQWVANHPPRP